MTTTVTVSAHCDPKTTKVRIITGDRDAPTRDEDKEKFILDGESRDFIVHGSKFISVDEVPK